MKHYLSRLAFAYYLVVGIIFCYLVFFLLWVVFFGLWAGFSGSEIPSPSIVAAFVGWPLFVLILSPGFIAFCSSFLWWRFTGIVFTDARMIVYLPIGSLWVRKTITYSHVRKVIISSNWMSQLFGLYIMKVVVSPKYPWLTGLTTLLNVGMFSISGGSYHGAYSYKISGLLPSQVDQIKKELSIRNITVEG